MQGHSIRYKRGTIWFCKDDEYENKNLRAGYNTHVQSNTRPVLIVSSDHGNKHSPIVNVVPLTTADKRSSVAVPLVAEDGTLSCILCNQIKTIDAKQLYKYMATVDDETMAEVEKTINYCLGISSRIEKSLSDLENMVENITKMKFKELSEDRADFDNIVEKLVKSLESTYGDLMGQYIANVNSASKRIKKAAPELDKTSVVQETENEDSESTPKKRNYTSSNKPKGYWTLERKAEYVSDYESHTIQWMMDNYEIGTEEQAKRRYYACRHDLKKANKN
jgi:mRNA interferase MazF